MFIAVTLLIVGTWVVSKNKAPLQWNEIENIQTISIQKMLISEIDQFNGRIKQDNVIKKMSQDRHG